MRALCSAETWKLKYALTSETWRYDSRNTRPFHLPSTFHHLRTKHVYDETFEVRIYTVKLLNFQRGAVSIRHIRRPLSGLLL